MSHSDIFVFKCLKWLILWLSFSSFDTLRELLSEQRSQSQLNTRFYKKSSGANTSCLNDQAKVLELPSRRGVYLSSTLVCAHISDRVEDSSLDDWLTYSLRKTILSLLF